MSGETRNGLDSLTSKKQDEDATKKSIYKSSLALDELGTTNNNHLSNSSDMSGPRSAMIRKRADSGSNCRKDGSTSHSAKKSGINNKKLSFYEDEDSDNDSIHSGQKQSNLSHLIANNIKSMPDDRIDGPENKTHTLPINLDKNNLKLSEKTSLDQGDTSSTSSCSCEDHSSVAGPDDFHGDLDYDEDSISGSPSRATPNGNAKIIEPTSSSSETTTATNHINKANLDLIATKSNVDHSSNKPPLETDKSNSKDNHKCAPRIKSFINFHHNDEDMEDRESNKSEDQDRTKSDKSQKSYDQLLRYFFKDACYFQIKSINHENVDISKSMGIWSTPVQNEIRLNSAFRDHRNVILVFSVQQSGGFQGFARMVSESRPSNSPVPWVLPERLINRSLGGIFKVEWLCTKELPFTEVADLHNPFNDNKPVKVARDGQQVEPRVGKKLCKLFPPDSKDRLLSCLATLKRQTSQRKKSSSRHGNLYPFVDRPNYPEERYRPDYGLIQHKNGLDESCLPMHMGQDHSGFNAVGLPYRPMSRRRVHDHSNLGPHHRQSLYTDQFSPMRPYGLPRHINGMPRYPMNGSHHDLHRNPGFAPPFNQQFHNPFEVWHPMPDPVRYHPYHRSRR